MIDWAVSALAGATFLMLLVLLVRRPVGHFFGARWAYALWLLPLLRLLPPMESLTSLLSPSFIEYTVLLIPAIGEAGAPSASAAGEGQLVPLLLALWAGGAAIFLAWQQATYSAFLTSLGNTPFSGEPKVYGGIQVIESRAVDGPLALGLLRRRIAVPMDFETRYDPAEQRLALEHELVHHKRGDIWWNMAGLLMLALNWFNPIAWIAFRAFRLDQELACDAAVATGSPGFQRHDYARALVKSASQPGLIAACPLNHADQLKRRLKMMKTHRNSLSRTLGGAIVLAALVAAAAVISPTTSFAQEERIVETEEKTITKRLIRHKGEKDGDVLRRREPGHLAHKCEGKAARSEIMVGGESDQRKMLIVICDKDGKLGTDEANAKLADALARAREDMDDKEMTAEQKAEFRARIDAEIARLRRGN